jgi:hypothetical protein
MYYRVRQLAQHWKESQNTDKKEDATYSSWTNDKFPMRPRYPNSAEATLRHAQRRRAKAAESYLGMALRSSGGQTRNARDETGGNVQATGGKTLSRSFMMARGLARSRTEEQSLKHRGTRAIQDGMRALKENLPR